MQHQTDETPLIVACRKGRDDVVELLVKREDVHMNAADRVSYPPLLWTAAHTLDSRHFVLCVGGLKIEHSYLAAGPLSAPEYSMMEVRVRRHGADARSLGAFVNYRALGPLIHQTPWS